jgi:hypothetical protein
VRFTATLPLGLASARRCNCSLCRMRGAVALTSTDADFRLESGADQLATYRFNTGAAAHHFCRTCGIYTHHKRRSNPEQIGVNAACLAGLSPFDFGELRVLDGERHPNDHGGELRLAGTLRFIPAETSSTIA